LALDLAGIKEQSPFPQESSDLAGIKEQSPFPQESSAVLMKNRVRRLDDLPLLGSVL